jgi:hypothetical protein
VAETTAVSTTLPGAEARAGSQAAAIPWFVWCSVVAVTSAIVGAHWDISWHRSIGRDTFWTPAHVAIYLCGVLSGLSSGYLILATTLGRAATRRESSVRIWGFRGPLGAFISAWGGVAMLTSAPFDDWWHNAYGLDVKIISPPHAVLFLGMMAVQVGTLILVLGHLNRALDAARRRLERVFLYVAAVILLSLLVFLMEETLRLFQHGSRFFRVIGLVVPVLLVGAARATGHRWAATIVAGIYTLFLAGLVWVLPLFPAEPKLGPVYQDVTHFIPPEFPLLILVPAFVLDLLRSRTASLGPWTQSAVSGLVFIAVFAAVQWPFASFMMTPLARNAFFGAHYFSYNLPPTTYLARHLFYPSAGSGLVLTLGLAEAVGMAVLSARAGLAWGGWMRRVQR